MKVLHHYSPFFLAIGFTLLLLYLWLRYFLPSESLLLPLGIFSFLLLWIGAHFTLESRFSRRWRTPARLLRWNVILALTGIGHLLLWGLFLLLLPTEANRLTSLFLGIIEGGIAVQAVGHLALAGHLTALRPRPGKFPVLIGYFMLTALLLLLRLGAPNIASLFAPLLWAGILPLLYFSEWLQDVAARRIPEALLLIGAALIGLFIEWQVALPAFSSSYPPLLEAIYSVLIAIVLLHGGWLLIPLLLRLARFSQSEEGILDLLTEFLAGQQRSSTPQAVLDLSSETLRRLPAVSGTLLLLRAGPEEEYIATNLPPGKVYEALRQAFFRRSGTEAYVEVIPSLQRESKMLPDLSAVIIQRPMTRLFGSLLTQTLHVAVLSKDPDGFEEKDIELILTLAEQTALFLENLERHSYQEQLITSRKEADFLKETREALLPPPPPILQKVDFYVHFEQYDRTIGGDYYQIYEYPEGDIIDFWLSDSAGSGIAAAYQMAQARAALNTLWLQRLSAEELIFRLNDSLKRLFHKNNFLAATLLRFDMKKKEYIIFRAGNPEIFYWNPLTDEVDLLRPSGIVLGNASSQIIGRILTPEKGRLMPGSLFLFFSDGFPEASNAEGEMFGTERLLALFKAHAHATPREIASFIVEEVRRFVGSSSLGDDGTLIVVRYLG
ncbi:MAG: PP2C family protein-serine/threonine phosphatase [Bacteroidia bacterium]|nr:serine/threonine-protein phosphatase [Bacteroidia bacterium]MDW8014422.1 PP2C family protein-serine/threonine phosphatase [Bacteroidia bacterium]